MKLSSILFLTLFSYILTFGQKVAELKNDDEKASYAIGIHLAQNFKPKGLDKVINLDIMKQAMQDKFENKQLLFSEDSIESFMADYIAKHLEKVSDINLKKGEGFLDENKKKPGVKFTDSGLQYKLEKEGTVVKLTDDGKASYAIGLNLAQNFKPQGLDKFVNLNIMKQAMQDKFENKLLLFPEDSVESFMSDYMMEHLKKVSEINLKKGEKFLAENKKKPGVKVTDSGLQYKVEKEGTGAKPTNDDVVSVNYVLKTIDGVVIEDSKKMPSNRPADIPLSKVIPGWKEGVKLMSKGAKYTLYVPADLAYGENGPTGLGSNQVLIFETELVGFQPDSKTENTEE